MKKLIKVFLVSFFCMIATLFVSTNCWAATQYINVNTPYAGNLENQNDIDYYYFTLNSEGKVWVSFTHELVDSGSWYWEVNLYDSDNNQITGFYSEGNKLNLRSNYVRLPAGTYYVRVEASSFSDIDYGLTVNYTAEGTGFEKENNGDFDNANAIVQNSKYTGNMQSSSDKDYYKFTLASPGKVWLSLLHGLVDSGSWYWEVNLYDSDNNQITGFYSQGNELNLRSNYVRLPAGTYYVRVEASSFSDIDYGLTVNYTAEGTGFEKENNGDFDNANAIVLNTKYTGNMQSSSDKDYYKFTLASPGKVWLSLLHGLVDSGSWYWEVNLYDSDNNQITGFYSEGNKLNLRSNYVRLPAGTYYVRVEASSFSDIDYGLTVNYTAEGTGFEKENNGDFDNANAIVLNTKYTGNTQNDSDTDYYKFTLTSSKKISINFTHSYINSYSTYWDVSLLKSDYQEIISFGSQGNTHTKNTNYITLPPGTYYIKVTGGASDLDYSVKLITPYLQYLSLSSKKVTIKKGKSIQVTVYAVYSDGTKVKITNATWKSSSTKIATVRNGKITGKAKGKTKIRVTYNNKSVSLDVVIK